MKNDIDSGIFIISPISTNTIISSISENVALYSCSFLLCFMYTFPNTSPAVVTASTPFPFSPSASTYVSIAAVIIASGDSAVEYCFLIILNIISPIITPVPIPVMNCCANGIICAVIVSTVTSVTPSITSSIRNGISTISGVLIIDSISSNWNIFVFAVPSTLIIASGAVAAITTENSSASIHDFSWYR